MSELSRKLRQPIARRVNPTSGTCRNIKYKKIQKMDEGACAPSSKRSWYFSTGKVVVVGVPATTGKATSGFRVVPKQHMMHYHKDFGSHVNGDAQKKSVWKNPSSDRCLRLLLSTFSRQASNQMVTETLTIYFYRFLSCLLFWVDPDPTHGRLKCPSQRPALEFRATWTPTWDPIWTRSISM